MDGWIEVRWWSGEGKERACQGRSRLGWFGRMQSGGRKGNRHELARWGGCHLRGFVGPLVWTVWSRLELNSFVAVKLEPKLRW